MSFNDPMGGLTCVSLTDGREMEIPQETVLCLGNFDGVHLAHRALLKGAVEARDRLFPNASVGVFCFEELPAFYLHPQLHQRLCSTEERLRRFAECGMEFAVLADFPSLRELTPRAYVKEILMERCRAVCVACGFNHRFGKNGAGDPELLKELFGNRLLLQEEILSSGQPISSSRIRTLIGEKRLQEAAALLGEPYSVTAPVLHGKGLGRTIGIPTVNQNFSQHLLIPPKGVYRTEVEVDGVVYPSLSNVGTHPTVDQDASVNCESYLLGYSGDLYGRILKVSFLEFLREEKRFESLDELKEQIEKDLTCIQARAEG